MDVVRAIVTVLVIPNSAATSPLAGAIIDDETGLINVNKDTMTVATHFRPVVQLSRVSATGFIAAGGYYSLFRVLWIVGTVPVDDKRVAIRVAANFFQVPQS